MGKRGQHVPVEAGAAIHRPPMKTLSRLIALICLSCCSEVLFAQTPRQEPPPENEAPAALPEVPADTPPTPAGPSGALFISRIEVRGVTRLTSGEVDAAVAPYQGREVSAEELQVLRSALTKLYVEHGFVNSVVALPDQNVEDGVVVLQAIEGRLERVSVEGKTHLDERYVGRRVEAHISSPLNLKELNDSVRILQQDPNIEKIDAQLGPGSAEGLSVLHLNVDDQPRVKVGAVFDNHHSSATGANEGTLNLDVHDLTGFGDVWHGTVVHSKGDTEGAAIFSMPLSAHNAALQFYYTRASAGIIEQPFDALNIRETTRAYGMQAIVPLIDRYASRLTFFAGVESERSNITAIDSAVFEEPEGEATVSLVNGGLDWVLHGPTTVAEFKFAYRRGLDIFGATVNRGTPQDNPIGADGVFNIEQWQGTIIQRLNAVPALNGLSDRAQVVLRGGAQLAQKPLLLIEKYVVGGYSTVRGVPENLLVRDNGVIGSMELQLPAPGWKLTPDPHDLVAALFLDYGRSWDTKNAALGNPVLNTSIPFDLITAGAGLLYNPFKGLNAEVYWGRSVWNNFGRLTNPLHFAPNDLQRRGVYFSLSYTYGF